MKSNDGRSTLKSRPYRKTVLVLLAIGLGALGATTAGVTSVGVAQAVPSAVPPAEAISAADLVRILGPVHADSGIVRWGGGDWYATAVQPPVVGQNASTAVDVQIYRWNGGAWAVQGYLSVPDLGAVPPSRLKVAPVRVSGLAGPTFEISTAGYGGVEASIVAAVGRAWRTVPFPGPSGLVGVVNGGAVSGGRVGEVTPTCYYLCTYQPAPSQWYQYQQGKFMPAAEPGPAPRCTLAALPPMSFGPSATVAFTKLACAGNLALATGTQRTRRTAVLFQRSGLAWHSLAETDQIATVASEEGLPLGPLEYLASHVGDVAKPAIAALVIYDQDVGNAKGGPLADSAIVDQAGGQWFVVSAPSPRRDGYRADIYRWDRKAWALRGSAPLALPDVNGAGSIVPVRLTGSAQPDFLITGNGADWNPASVVSSIGGHWHAVPFEQGGWAGTLLTSATSGPTVIDEGQVQGRLIQTREDGCGCAAGPESYLWEAYRAGAFRPAPPPGPAPQCAAVGLVGSNGVMFGPFGSSPPLTFTAVACADGWALAVAQGAGYQGHAVGLFEQQDGQWKELELDNGMDLGFDLKEYDIPPNLLQHLGHELGPAVAPEVTAAEPPQWLGLPAGSSLSGVMVADGAYWMIDADQPTVGPAQTAPRANITVLCWTGRRWSQVGHVNGVADDNNLLGGGLWYSAVEVHGSPFPGFDLTASPGVNWNLVIGFRNGSWRVVDRGRG
ncbi:MAG TPA: hypothetical protein VFN61_09210 [Acidimicrobiales bacterium]|nr:hypothetical protein [Acidimicrobiales bacterium]